MTKTFTKPRNLTMMTDLYQLTMMNGYFLDGSYRNEAVFDVFFRANGQLNYAIAAGLAQAVDYIKNLTFSEDDLTYLAGLHIFDPAFIDSGGNRGVPGRADHGSESSAHRGAIDRNDALKYRKSSNAYRHQSVAYRVGGGR